MATTFTLNGKPVTVEGDGTRMLVWALRTDLGHTGTKVGCEAGLCGACTVLVDDEAVRSCSMPLRAVNGRKVTTIEGLAAPGALHPLQAAFVKHSAFQCGFCTPGMLLNAYALLLKRPQPTRAEILEHMEGNLCRCGVHQRIVAAIEEAAAVLKGGAR